jgi:hypothetical protein
MGYNTTVIVMDDALAAIANDPEFGKNLAIACMDKFSQQTGMVPVIAGKHLNAASVVDTHHADQTAIIAVGGNCATVMAYHYDWRHHDPEVQERILKTLADKLGYTVRKKPTRKPLKNATL